jgi:ATP-dependent protease HslVU (ClpYQ) peptidase subunit
MRNNTVIVSLQQQMYDISADHRARHGDIVEARIASHVRRFTKEAKWIGRDRAVDLAAQLLNDFQAELESLD